MSGVQNPSSTPIKEVLKCPKPDALAKPPPPIIWDFFCVRS